METDVIIQFGIFFFCIALLTFWFKKRWKKKPEAKVSSYPENEVRGKWKKLKGESDDEDGIGGKWTAERHEPERSKEPEPEPPERSKEPEPEPPEKEPESEPPEKEPKEERPQKKSLRDRFSGFRHK